MDMDDLLRKEAMSNLLMARENNELDKFIFGIGIYAILAWGSMQRDYMVSLMDMPIETVFEYSKTDITIIDEAKKSMEHIADTFRNIDDLFRITRITYYTEWYQNSHDVPKKIETADVLEHIRQNIIRNRELYNNDSAHFNKYLQYDYKYGDKLGVRIIDWG